jgi:predicted N-acyltransferase
MVPGDSAPASWYADIFRYYLVTWNKHMGTELRPFLNEDFFRLLGREFKHRVRFSAASRAEENLAMAIFYEKAGNLYGRYWGSAEPVPFLHFATCYYHPIRYAIDNGVHSMDPVGGEHKLYRAAKSHPPTTTSNSRPPNAGWPIRSQSDQTQAAKGKKDW